MDEATSAIACPSNIAIHLFRETTTRDFRLSSMANHHEEAVGADDMRVVDGSSAFALAATTSTSFVSVCCGSSPVDWSIS